MGRYPEGLDAAERAAVLDPALTEAWVNKGTALIALGRYEEAVAASGKALEIDPSSEDAKKNRQTAQEALENPPSTRAPLPVHILLGAPGLVASAAILRRMQK